MAPTLSEHDLEDPDRDIGSVEIERGAAGPFPARAVSKPIVKHGAGGMARPGRFRVREINKTERVDAVNIVEVSHCCRIRLSCSGSIVVIRCQKLI